MVDNYVVPCGSDFPLQFFGVGCLGLNSLWCLDICRDSVNDQGISFPNKCCSVNLEKFPNILKNGRNQSGDVISQILLIISLL